MQARITMAALATLAAVGLSLPSAVSALAFEDCQLSAPGVPVTREAECARMAVPENPAEPNGATIELKIARVDARTGEPAPDPVFFFAGGPGQAATEAYITVAEALEPGNRKRDIVLIDQRGTGGSNKLSCPGGGQGPLAELDPARVVQSTRECLDGLDADPRFYTTGVAMRDYERVRKALGYERINLLGVSYGTRAALTYLRMYPQHVRSIVLDGVVPPGLALGAEHAPNLDRALEAVFEHCRQTEACRARFNDPGATLAGLLSRVADKAPTITLRAPTSGEKRELSISREIIAVALRLLSYASESQAVIPLLLDQAAGGDWQPIAAQALVLSEGLQRQLARGMELSVICSEDVPRFPDTVDHDDTLLGGLMVEVLRKQCAVWPKGPVAEDFNEPLAASPVPALLLSGEHDPVTPARYGERTAGQFRNAVHWVIRGRGHNVIRHGCLPDKLAAFFETADPQGLETECLERIGPAPFFVSPTGPRP